jgi:polar amino acid transport system ATP-binding protein
MNYELKQTVFCLDNISAGYDDKIILKDINVCVKDIVREGVDATGQIIAVVGRSGRGKSTLFRIITGLMKPASGRVLITTSNPNEPESAKEIGEGDVGFVNQKYTLFRHKTVYQMLMYALKKSELSKTEKNNIVNDELIKWGLIDHKNKYPCELSGGQRQRTAIIEQLLTSKHFVIFDEPFSGLDVGNIQSVKDSFNMILSNNELNTIIFSTHDIRLAVELADTIFVVGYPNNQESTTIEPTTTLEPTVGTKKSFWKLFKEDIKNDEKNTSNVEYSTIIKTYDLKEMGLAWTTFGIEHLNLMEQIVIDLLNS